MDGETVTLKEHIGCHFAWLHLLLSERDRRYSEVSAERDRRYGEVSAARAEALKIKEQADRDALKLARDQQTYKDEQGNKLREQLNAERGEYATHAEIKSAVEKLETAIAPVINYVVSQQGRSGGILAGRLDTL